MKFLVVDDSSTMRRIVANTINKIGYKDITLAEDGQDAINKMKKNNFDIIMTDWNMPNMNGLELVKSARKMENYKEIPIIMITTEGGREQVLIALKNGVNNYIVKPFNAATLQTKLEDII